MKTMKRPKIGHKRAGFLGGLLAIGGSLLKGRQEKRQAKRAYAGQQAAFNLGSGFLQQGYGNAQGYLQQMLSGYDKDYQRLGRQFESGKQDILAQSEQAVAGAQMDAQRAGMSSIPSVMQMARRGIAGDTSRALSGLQSNLMGRALQVSSQRRGTLGALANLQVDKGTSMANLAANKPIQPTFASGLSSAVQAAAGYNAGTGGSFLKNLVGDKYGY